MEEVAAENDLGIYVDTELKFRKQAAAAVSKTSQVMAVIWHSFQLLDKLTLLVLFKTLVQQHLEYGNVVWGPFNRADQQLVEHVQRRAMKMVLEMHHLSYPELLLSVPQTAPWQHDHGTPAAAWRIRHRPAGLLHPRS